MMGRLFWVTQMLIMLSSQGYFSCYPHLLHWDLTFSASCCCLFSWLILRCLWRLQLWLRMLWIDLCLVKTRVWLKIFYRSIILQMICRCTVRMSVRTKWLKPPVKWFSISALALKSCVPKYLLTLHRLEITSAKRHFMFTELGHWQLIRRGLCMHNIVHTRHSRMFEVMQVFFSKRRADLIRGWSMLKASWIDRRSTSSSFLGILTTSLCTTILLTTRAFQAKSIRQSFAVLTFAWCWWLLILLDWFL